MLRRNTTSVLALAGALLVTTAGAHAFDETKYPDWSGQWRKPSGIGNQWDQTKPPGRAQQAPLTAEYQGDFRGESRRPGRRRSGGGYSDHLRVAGHAAHDDGGSPV
jgi:hypothetical protein